MTAPLIASREALAESICRSFHALHFAQMPGACPSCNRLADALLASDAIQTPAEFAAGLAEDEALIERAAQIRHAQLYPDSDKEWADLGYGIQQSWLTQLAEDARALAAALTERGQA